MVGSGILNRFLSGFHKNLWSFLTLDCFIQAKNFDNHLRILPSRYWALAKIFCVLKRIILLSKCACNGFSSFAKIRIIFRYLMSFFQMVLKPYNFEHLLCKISVFQRKILWRKISLVTWWLEFKEWFLEHFTQC